MVRSPFALRFAGAAIALLVLTWAAAARADHAGGACRFGSHYPADCSADEARAIFERQMRALHSQHRVAIARLADALERDFEGKQDSTVQDETPATLATARQLLAVLRSASDPSTAMQLALQQRSRLSAQRQKQVAVMIEQLSSLVDEVKQAKAAYQPYLADSIRRRWESLALSEKRELLREYWYLAGEAPDWLLQHSPKAPLPLSPSTADKLREFEHRAEDRLRTAERRFQPQRVALLARLEAALTEYSLSESERQAVAAIAKLLEADYGKGFRGLMLLEVDAALPQTLREEVAGLMKAYRAELAQLRAERSDRVAELRQALEPVREAHLKRGEFAGLLAIDIRLEELKQILRPLQIMARREAGIAWHEDVLLLDVRQADFRIRFLRDKHEAWLPREQVMLRPSDPSIRTELTALAPAGGPGTRLSDRTVLRAGQTLMGYHGDKWYPVTVVDVSPFGVVITWQAFREETTQLLPRRQLRLLNDR